MERTLYLVVLHRQDTSKDMIQKFLAKVIICSFRGYDRERFTKDRQRQQQERRHIFQEKQRQVEERRVVYVGKITEGTTRADLRKRFEVFGPIEEISVHFRDRG